MFTEKFKIINDGIPINYWYPRDNTSEFKVVTHNLIFLVRSFHGKTRMSEYFKNLKLSCDV